MNYLLLSEKIQSGLSTYELASEFKTSQTNIRYHLKKMNLKTDTSVKRKHKCSVCGSQNPEEFYGHKRTTCGKCHKNDVLSRGQEKRLMALEYLGGKCKVCEFSKYKTALDIHHLDPKQKDSNFASMRGWSWNRIQSELDKCILLCKNCHSAFHNGELSL